MKAIRRHRTASDMILAERVEYINEKRQQLWKWATTPGADVVLIAGGVVWLTGVVLWPEVKNWWLGTKSPTEPHPAKQPPQPPKDTQEVQAPVVVAFSDFSLEKVEFNKLRNEFHELSWAQQVALATIQRYSGMQFDALVNMLERMGFKDVGLNVVSPLMQSKFVEVTGQRNDICINPARRASINSILEDWKRHAL